jgi:hypothetical protein
MVVGDAVSDPDTLTRFFFRDYYAALLRTYPGQLAPVKGNLLNYIQRVPLGVVAQITVRFLPA